MRLIAKPKTIHLTDIAEACLCVDFEPIFDYSWYFRWEDQETPMWFLRVDFS